MTSQERKDPECAQVPEPVRLHQVHQESHVVQTLQVTRWSRTQGVAHSRHHSLLGNTHRIDLHLKLDGGKKSYGNGDGVVHVFCGVMSLWIIAADKFQTRLIRHK